MYIYCKILDKFCKTFYKFIKKSIFFSNQIVNTLIGKMNKKNREKLFIMRIVTLKILKKLCIN